MIADTATIQPRQTAFELIAPFAESVDARLRGNAVYALTALAGVSDPSLREQAKQELVRVLSTDPGSGLGDDWQRRFIVRALDALRNLPAGDRNWIRDQILKLSRSARETTQSRAVARLILGASEPSGQLWRVDWREFMQLARMAGRPGFWRCLWFATWRSSVAWLLFYLTAYLEPWFDQSSSFESKVFWAAAFSTVVSSLLLGTSTRFSLAGRITPSLRVCLVDGAVGAGFFMVLAVVGTSVFIGWDDDIAVLFRLAFETPTTLAPLMEVALLGFVMGAVLRFLRWGAASIRIEREGTTAVLRPLAAFSFATIVCVGAARIGMDVTTVSAAWIVLAFAGSVAASLDAWLETLEPQPLLPSQSRQGYRWALHIVAVGILVLSISIVSLNAYRLSQKVSTWDAVSLPAALGSAGRTTIPAQSGVPFPIDVEDNTSFTIAFDGNLSPDDSIEVVDSKDRPVESTPAYGPSISVGPLERGRYYACAEPQASQRSAYCSSLKLREILDFAMLIIGIDPRGPQMDGPTVTLIISSRAVTDGAPSQ